MSLSDSPKKTPEAVLLQGKLLDRFGWLVAAIAGSTVLTQLLPQWALEGGIGGLGEADRQD